MSTSRGVSGEGDKRKGFEWHRASEANQRWRCNRNDAHKRPGLPCLFNCFNRSTWDCCVGDEGDGQAFRGDLTQLLEDEQNCRRDAPAVQANSAGTLGFSRNPFGCRLRRLTVLARTAPTTQNGADRSRKPSVLSPIRTGAFQGLSKITTKP